MKTDSDHAENVGEILGGLSAGLFSEATMHLPTSVIERALQLAKSLIADSIISIGGGGRRRCASRYLIVNFTIMYEYLISCVSM